jgi:hypothetical protein
LIRLAARRIGIVKFCDYIVLGDDVVIFSKDVADSYKSVLTEIGVKIDPVDSFYSETYHSLEFAKRLFRYGREVSPLPLRLMKQEISLFQLYVLERGMNYRISATSKDERLKRFSSYVLYLLKVIPLWSHATGRRNPNQEFYSKIIDLGSESPEYKI